MRKQKKAMETHMDRCTPFYARNVELYANHILFNFCIFILYALFFVQLGNICLHLEFQLEFACSCRRCHCCWLCLFVSAFRCCIFFSLGLFV